MRHERRGLRGSTRPIHVHAHSTTGGTFPPLQRLHRAPFTAARPRARPMMPTPSGKEGSANTCGSPPLCQALATGECMYVRYSAVCSRSGAGGSGGSDCSHEAERPSRCSPFLDHTCKNRTRKRTADTVRLSVCQQSTDQKSCLSVWNRLLDALPARPLLPTLGTCGALLPLSTVGSPPCPQRPSTPFYLARY